MIKMSKLLGIIVLALVFSLIGCSGGGGSSEKPDNNKPQNGDGGAKITKLVIKENYIYVVLEFEETVWASTYLDESSFKLKINGMEEYKVNLLDTSASDPIELGHSCTYENEKHVITQVVGTEYEVTVVYTKPAGNAELVYDRKDSNHDNIPVPSFTVTQKIVATAN